MTKWRQKLTKDEIDALASIDDEIDSDYYQELETSITCQHLSSLSHRLLDGTLCSDSCDH